MDGQGSRKGLGGVEFLLAGLKVVEKATPGAFFPGECTTGGFQATLPDIHIAL